MTGSWAGGGSTGVLLYARGRRQCAEVVGSFKSWVHMQTGMPARGESRGRLAAKGQLRRGLAGLAGLSSL